MPPKYQQPFFEPSVEEIAAECGRMQQEWTDAQRMSRQHGHGKLYVAPPEVEVTVVKTAEIFAH